MRHWWDRAGSSLHSERQNDVALSEAKGLLSNAGIGFLGGLAAGYILWNIQISRSKRDLFSKSPVRRLAALGYLGGQPGVETARLLTDYVQWERRPALRRRGAILLRRMNEYLD